jgi:hypothetical protein
MSNPCPASSPRARGDVIFLQKLLRLVPLLTLPLPYRDLLTNQTLDGPFNCRHGVLALVRWGTTRRRPLFLRKAPPVPSRKGNWSSSLATPQLQRLWNQATLGNVHEKATVFHTSLFLFTAKRA